MWLRNGLTVDTGRLIDEVGFRPRSTADAVDDFVAELRGRRALPIGPSRSDARSGGRGGSERMSVDRHAAQRERARRLRLDIEGERRDRAVRTESRRPAPSRGDAEAARAALDFLALLREATRQGSDLPAAVERAAGTLPARRATSRAELRGGCGASTRRTSGASTRSSSRSSIRCSS